MLIDMNHYDFSLESERNDLVDNTPTFMSTFLQKATRPVVVGYVNRNVEVLSSKSQRDLTITRFN